jgi:hypothetical protein
MRRLLIFACVATTLLGGCALIMPHRYRFKLTVEVQTPDGLRRGSSVYQVSAANLPAVLPNEAKRDWSVRGEAVAVDLPDGRTLFALMRTRNRFHQDLALMSLASLDPKFKNDVVESAGRVALGFTTRQKADVQTGDYPLLVVFGDNADPGTAKEVELGSPSNLGPGYGPIRMSVESTSELVTSGIERRLPWLSTHHGALIHIPFKDYPPPGEPLPLGARITERDFRQK